MFVLIGSDDFHVGCFLTFTRNFYSGHGSEVVKVGPKESVEVSVYTKSTAGASFVIQDDTRKVPRSAHVTAKHSGTQDDFDIPTSVNLTSSPIKGPVTLKVKADSNGSRFSTHNYLIVFTFKNL